MDKDRYNKPLETDIGDLFTIGDFKEMVASRCLIDYDGHGSLVKDNMMDDNTRVYPSEVDQIPEDATHILWYNK